MNGPIAVIGGTGPVGRLVTRKLLERGAPVRVIGRSVPRARRHLPPLAPFLLADVREPETLRTPLRGCSAVVCTVESGAGPGGPGSPESTLYTGVVNTLEVLLGGSGSEAPQLVLVSRPYGTDTDRPGHTRTQGPPPDRCRAGEDAVRTSGLPYTVVRDLGDGQLSAQGVAEACVQALYCPSARGVTVECLGGAGAPPAGWADLFAALPADDSVRHPALA